MKLTKSKPKPSKACLMCSFISSDLLHASQRASRFISGNHVQYVAKETYDIPNAQHCQQALEIVTEFSPEYLVNHCLRSYAFGVAMAHRVKKSIDKKVFFLGAIMHDLGLTPTFDSGNSFEIDGAEAARSFCIEHEIEAQRADLVHEMVALHNSVGIAHKLDPEIALLHFGAGADVAGLWIKDIHKQTLSDVLEEFPRLDFKQGMMKLISEQVNRKPQSFMAPFIELGFLKKIDNVSF